MHGLGDSAYGFCALPMQLDYPDDLPVRWVFPQAPRRPVTLNAGMVMRAWYDVYSLQDRIEVDLDGLRQSMGQVEALLRREAERGVPPERTVLAGFSMGGAMSLYVGLRYPERLAGILAASTSLHDADRLQTDGAAANRQTPIFLAHGVHDGLVPVSLGEQARDALLAAGYPVAWHQYPMEHTVGEQELQDVKAWLHQVLGLPA
jgi:phospholipase/carboxylesterase